MIRLNNNNIFKHSEWSAPMLDTLEQILDCITSFNLVGRKIKRMKFVGLCYNLTQMWIENHAYSQLKELDDEERQRTSEYDNIDGDIKFPRFAEIDEPFLIQFEDGEQLELEGIEDYSYRMSMNCIPWDIKAGVNPQNADANVLFDVCLGAKINSVEVIPAKDEHCRADNIILWLENDAGIKICGINIHIFIDYCHIHIVDCENKNDLTITMKELKNGLFNRSK